ncbi:TetR/AcrR family transcriptional regulator [Streptomyces sp. NPDC000594]|uniref:TetR/AcrR family transcriptional regulator n=1 Tax=Streptomyces sp. NPDC000594 TaxID=3154261 RepID=UPI00332469BF
MTTETSGSGDLSRTLDLLWGTGERPTRGPRPGLTLDRIVATAIAVADAEGLAAVSMRRIAAELGTGTMTLYRYVPGKDELLDLMLDRVTDPGPPADAAPAECADRDEVWRTTVRAMAHGYRDLYRAHPWLLRVNRARTLLGPSSLRAMEMALSGLRPSGLDDPELLSVMLLVQSYVTGMALAEADAAQAQEETGQSEEEFWRQQSPYLERAMLSGEYPVSATLSDDTFSRDVDHFDFGLQRVLDGLEALIGRRRAAVEADGER